MLAKIALGIAAARFGLDQFEEIYIRDCILNKRDDVGVWVGGDYWKVPDAQIEYESRARHGSAIAVDEKRNVVVRVRLFSFSPHSPAYMVVVGKLKPEVSNEMVGKVAEAFTKVGQQ